MIEMIHEGNISLPFENSCVTIFQFARHGIELDKMNPILIENKFISNSKANMIQDFTSKPNFGRFQNQGYEYLSSIYRMKEEHDLLSSRGITPYIMPVKVLVVACLAIEEYINLAGFRIDSNWEEFDHENEPVKDRIAHLFELLGQPVNFETGIWKDVLGLFEMEKKLKGYSRGLVRYHEAEIPEIIKDAVKKYPIRLSQAIAEKAIEVLLSHSSLSFPLERVMSLI